MPALPECLALQQMEAVASTANDSEGAPMLQPMDTIYAKDVPAPTRHRCCKTRSWLALSAAVNLLAVAMVVWTVGDSPTETSALWSNGGPGSCPNDYTAPGHEAAPTSLNSETIPLIFDADFGSFMDDSFALAYVLGSPELRLDLALATGGPRPELRAAALARHLDEAGRGHVPIGLSPAVATELGMGALLDWAAAYDISSYPAGLPVADGVAAAANIVRGHAAGNRQVTWMILGPSTAAADFAARFPELVQHVRIVVMGASICTGMDSPWKSVDEDGEGSPYPVAATNERQNVPAARSMIRAPWGGGPPLFTGIRATLGVKLDGDAYRRLRDASNDHAAYPALQPLFNSYLAWWQASFGMSTTTSDGEVASTAMEANSVDPLAQSVVMFDVLAAYLALSQRGLVVVTFAADFTDDGHTALSAAEATRQLPTGCNVSKARVLPAGADRDQELVDLPLVGIVVGWQTASQLQLFKQELLSRLLRGGRACG